jgi:protein phosphatase
VTSASLQHPSLAGMSTTLTAVFSAGDELFVAHVGHSRAYLYRGGLLTRLTRDQTLAQRLAETGRTSPTELAATDLRHVLTDALGGRAGDPDIEIHNYLLMSGDVVMLCTNGLTDLVDDDGIAGVLRAGQGQPLDAQCRQLVNLALDRGGPDNVTVIMARYHLR